MVKEYLHIMQKNSDDYLCPICGGSVVLRQGSINIAHFAHRSNECADSWHYKM